jgi:hypothetical protein
MLDTSAVGTAERCRVLLRLKPCPLDETSPICVDGTRISVRRDSRESRDLYEDANNSTFSFDQIFGSDVSQEELFRSVSQESIEPVLSGM